MSNSAEQEEEIEVLNSIFEGDEAFKQLSDTEFQYKIGEDGSNKSFLLTINWPDEYPTCKPEINMDAFYNKHINEDVKCSIIESVNEQAETLLGEAATYTIIDWVKENVDTLVAQQPDTLSRDNSTLENTVANKKEKKEQLTKAQKRKMANRMVAGGELPRGYDWFDVVKHLSQTGKASD